MKIDEFRTKLLTNIVLKIEDDSGFFEDSKANRIAKHEINFASFLQKRAIILCEDTRFKPIKEIISTFLDKVFFLYILIACFGLLSGIGMISLVLSAKINVFQVLAKILIPSFIMLLIWIVFTFVKNTSNNIFAKLFDVLGKKLYKNWQDFNLFLAIKNIIYSTKVCKYFFGELSHLFWVFFFVGIIGNAMFQFSFTSFAFTIESSLFDKQNLSAFVESIGFLYKDTTNSVIDFVNHNSNSKNNIGMWFILTIIVYGLLPRLIFLLYCCTQRLIQKQQYKVNTQNAQRLHMFFIKEHFAAEHSLNAAEHHVDTKNNLLSKKVFATFEIQQNNNIAIDGFEFQGCLDKREDRKTLLNNLSQNKISNFILVCNAQNSFDRNTKNLILEIKYLTDNLTIMLLKLDESNERCLQWLDFLNNEKIAWRKNNDRTLDDI